MPLKGVTEAMTKETRLSKTVYVDVSGVSETVALPLSRIRDILKEGCDAAAV